MFKISCQDYQLLQYITICHPVQNFFRVKICSLFNSVEIRSVVLKIRKLLKIKRFLNNNGKVCLPFDSVEIGSVVL